ncbi:Cell division topological determinant MinJ [compost metagenome]
MLGILQVILLLVPEAVDWRGVGAIVQVITAADIPSLLVIVGILHILEGMLTGLQGVRMASPLFYEGKRGQIIGGYQLQGFWPVPLFLLIPMQGGSSDLIPWGTLFNTSYAAGWSILAFPVMIGFTELTMSRLPREKTSWSARMLMLYGLIILLMAVLAQWWTPFILVAALCSIGLHEALIAYSSWMEARQSPLYVHSNRGLMVLGIVPNSPAADLGIQIGEIIHKVNGYKVLTKTDLHHAMQLHSAFCKLEVVNLQGEIKFLQRAIYNGEHHQLGIILAPDQHAMYVLALRPLHLFTYLRNKITGVLTNQSGRPM